MTHIHTACKCWPKVTQLVNCRAEIQNWIDLAPQSLLVAIRRRSEQGLIQKTVYEKGLESRETWKRRIC
jgi:hypothetical protein